MTGDAEESKTSEKKQEQVRHNTKQNGHGEMKRALCWGFKNNLAQLLRRTHLLEWWLTRNQKNEFDFLTPLDHLGKGSDITFDCSLHALWCNGSVFGRVCDSLMQMQNWMPSFLCRYNYPIYAFLNTQYQSSSQISCWIQTCIQTCSTVGFAYTQCHTEDRKHLGVLVCCWRADKRLEPANWFPRMRRRENGTKREWESGEGEVQIQTEASSTRSKTKAVSRKCSTQLPSWPQQHPPVSLMQAHTHAGTHKLPSVSTATD